MSSLKLTVCTYNILETKYTKLPRLDWLLSINSQFQCSNIYIYNMSSILHEKEKKILLVLFANRHLCLKIRQFVQQVSYTKSSILGLQHWVGSFICACAWSVASLRPLTFKPAIEGRVPLAIGRRETSKPTHQHVAWWGLLTTQLKTHVPCSYILTS